MDGCLGRVEDILRGYGSIAICFSGGLDSTVLADIAHRTLGDRAVAVMVDVPMMTSRQRDSAVAIAEAIGIKLETARLGYGDLPDILGNTHDRCYICKTAMYGAVRRRAGELGLSAVVNGEIVDDLSEDRPGMRAGEENRIGRPFIDAGVGRDLIRDYIDNMDLPARMVKDTCMLMRYPEGMSVTESDLRLVEELESEVRAVTGVSQLRVRRKGDGFSIQTSTPEIGTLRSHEDGLEGVFRSRGLGYRIDPNGYDK